MSSRMAEKNRHKSMDGIRQVVEHLLQKVNQEPDRRAASSDRKTENKRNVAAVTITITIAYNVAAIREICSTDSCFFFTSTTATVGFVANTTAATTTIQLLPLSVTLNLVSFYIIYI